MKLSIFKRHPREALSAYLDGELIPLRIEAMQAHLASCPPCRTELEALRELKAGLATLPEMAAPRSFALTPEIAARPLRDAVRPAVPAHARAMANGMRLAGAGMTLALVLVLVLDFAGSGSNSDNTPTAANVEQFSAAQSNDSSFSGIAGAPTPAASHDDLRDGSAPADATALPGSQSSEGVSGAGVPATPGLVPAPVVGAPSPAIVQTGASPAADKSAGGTTQDSATSAPAALKVQPSDFALRPVAASPGSGGGVDVLLIVAIALAAGIVLTVAASFVLPRLGRGDV